MSSFRSLWLGLCVLVLAGVSARGSEQAAVAAYRAGDLALARTHWIALLDAEPRPEGAERARILGNLGNVAFRAGKPLESVGWFTASIRLRPRDADTWANLEHARRVGKLEPADRGDLAATVRRLLGALTPAESRLLALVGLVGLAATLAYEALRGGRTGRWLAAGGFAFAVLSATPWIHEASTRLEAPAIVVAEGKSLVRSEPRAEAAVVAEAPAGLLVEMLDELPGWTKVRVQGGSEGWVAAAEVFDLAR